MKIKVKDLPYKRYTIEEMRTAFAAFDKAVSEAKCADDVIAARNEFMKAQTEYQTAASLSNCRYTLNTRDEFYLGEMNYYDENGPLFEEIGNKYAEVMLGNKFRKEVEAKMNPLIFKGLEIVEKCYNSCIEEEKKQENALVTEYSQLMSQIAIKWRGEDKPLSYVRGFLEDSDREVRREACIALGEGLDAHKAELDELFDKLVKNRDLQAKKMGYKNFVELGYYRMARLDYDRKMVEAFRKNVAKSLVPVVAEVKKEIAADMGIDRITFYDDAVYTADDPRPILDKDGIFKAAQKMYDDMRPEIGEFMRSMQEAEAFDVDARDGKWGGGYCTEFDKFKQTFILANFNGSSGDVDVMTHEFGHAFAMNQQFYTGDPELGVGGMETAECHSMSMEFFSWKYMDLFFGENADKYRLKHLLSSLCFIPYGVAVDEFQHIVYENPEMTPAERLDVWKALEKKYRPYLDIEGLPFIGEGRRWQYQMHIYESPFYYIDYTLAQTVALGFLIEMRKDYENALDRYVAFAKKGGTEPFSKLVAEAGLANPFGDGTLDAIASEILKIVKELKKE